jgi:hypothetical protein
MIIDANVEAVKTNYEPDDTKKAFFRFIVYDEDG